MRPVGALTSKPYASRGHGNRARRKQLTFMTRWAQHPRHVQVMKSCVFYHA